MKAQRIIRKQAKNKIQMPIQSINRLLSFSSILTAQYKKTEENRIQSQSNYSECSSIKTDSIFEFPSSANNQRTKKIELIHKDFGTLREIESARKQKKKRFSKITRAYAFRIILAIFLIGGLLGIIAAAIIGTLKNKTTTSQTTVTTTTATTATTTTITTTTTSITTTTTTTSVTTTTTVTTATSATTTTTTTQTTTTTTTPVICPSAVWHPNGTTVAGSSLGYSGSKLSLLNGAYDVRVDSALNVYVADYSNYRFMKWTPNSTNGTVFGPQLGAGGTSDTAHLNTATTLAFDSTESNMYLSDTFNCRILKMNIASGNISVIIGPSCGTALNKFYWCDGLYVDRSDNLYVADWINDRILKFPPNTNPSTNGTIIAGTGVAGSALNGLNTPWNIFVDEPDNDALYIADYENHRIMKWYPNSTNGTIVAGGNGVGSGYHQLRYPQAVYVDSFSTVYIADYGNHRIMKWTKNATNGTLVAGYSGISGNSPAHLYLPSGIHFDKNGYMYVSEYGNNRVQRFTIDNTSC